MPISYPLDSTGTAIGNKIVDEIHVLTEINNSTYRILMPTFAPFYLDNLVVKHVDDVGNITVLIHDVDYYVALPFIGASRSIGKMLYGAIAINTNLIDGIVKVTYQTIGGEWAEDVDLVKVKLAEIIYNPRITTWDLLLNKPHAFPPINHTVDLNDLSGFEDLLTALGDMSAILADRDSPGGAAFRHAVDLTNPHGVTALQVGLGDVENLPMATDAEVNTFEYVHKYVTLAQVLRIARAVQTNVPIPAEPNPGQ